MSNGTVISRVGTAAVALHSEMAGRPVLICCETYKFAERVQLDSITANELGNPDALLSGLPASPLAGWKDVPHLGERGCHRRSASCGMSCGCCVGGGATSSMLHARVSRTVASVCAWHRVMPWVALALSSLAAVLRVSCGSHAHLQVDCH